VAMVRDDASRAARALRSDNRTVPSRARSSDSAAEPRDRVGGRACALHRRGLGRRLQA
jgi:hypothetical protein